MNQTAASTPVSRSPVESFHEWPLVVFTTLAIMGAGTLTAPLVAGIVARSAAAAEPVMLVGSLLLAAGLAVSLAHLGRPARAPRAAARFGHSWLSTEVVLGGLAMLSGLLVALRPHAMPGVALTTGVLGALFLATLGLVYRLPGQPTWRGAVVFVPMTTGLGFGALTLAVAWDGAIIQLGAAAAILLAADTILFVIRRFTLTWPRVPIVPRHPALYPAPPPAARRALRPRGGHPRPPGPQRPAQGRRRLAGRRNPPGPPDVLRLRGAADDGSRDPGRGRNDGELTAPAGGVLHSPFSILNSRFLRVHWFECPTWNPQVAVVR